MSSTNYYMYKHVATYEHHTTFRILYLCIYFRADGVARYYRKANRDEGQQLGDF